MPHSPLLYVAIAALTLGVFTADLLTPLGIAVWILYVVPLGLTLFGRNAVVPPIGALVATGLMVLTVLTDAPGITPWVAYVNRACGIAVMWTLALVVRGLILHRNRVEAEDWIRTTQARLFESMQGDRPLREVADRALAVLAEALDAPVAALYVSDGADLRLAAAQGLRAEIDVPPVFRVGEGLVGQAAASRRLTVLREVPEGFFPVRSGLGSAPPRHLVVAALEADGAVQGVLELGCLRAPDDRMRNLIERTRATVAVALRSASYRTRLRELLEETQRQAEELQAQQEELRVANEELEEQSRALRSSQSRLEQEQAELEATNAQLEVQAEELERQKLALTEATGAAERASQYKSEFLANMSHELRTPLNSVLILAKLLGENKGARLSDDEVRYAETIYGAGNNLLALINDILDLAKIEAGAVEIEPDLVSPRRLLEALQRTFQPIADDKGLGFRIEVLPGTPEQITTDGQRVQQIATNLLSNAFKFTDRGEVVLRVSSPAPDAIELEVRDTGVGIAADKRELIFQAFRQSDGSTHRKYGGTGLGLSISLELARMLGGDLRVESEVDVGSAFTLVLPRHLSARGVRAAGGPVRAATPAAPAPVAIARPAAADGKAPPARDVRPSLVGDDRDELRRPGRLILVVEDDLAFARILYDLAHELDFDCVVATSVDEGMALARDLAPSGVLLDVALPDGSGLTLLDRMKRNPDTRHIPIHVVSVADYARPALEMGAVGYALKPVERDAMVSALRKLEARLDRRVRRVLVVEDDEELRRNTEALLDLEGVVIEGVGTAAEALGRLAAESFDCIVLDLALPDASGYDLLETMAGSEQYSFPPVIVYTGRDLSPDDEDRLRRYSRSVIVKGARSPERLLDEVTLFLHQVESRLPPDARRLLRAVRERDAAFEGKSILVVEDDVRNVFALSSVLEPRGARVTIARNGREAIERIEAERPDLVLMDVMMPEMDGLTAIRLLRARPEYRDLPIVALTAKAMRDDCEQCLAAGADDYMTKPIDVDKLVSLCRVWMSR